MTEKRGDKPEKLKEQKPVRSPAMTKSDARAPLVQMHDLLGDKLRAYYDQVASEPVPDRFEQLLRQLEAQGKDVKNG